MCYIGGMKVPEKSKAQPKPSDTREEERHRFPRHLAAEVSRFLGVPVGLLYRWGKGYRSNGYRINQLVIKSPDVWWNWLELLHAVWLSELYPFGEEADGLHRFFMAVAEHFDEDCPMGLERFWSVEERPALRRQQLESRLDERFWLVVKGDDGQLALSPAAQRFFDRLTFDEWGWVEQLVLEKPTEPGDAPIVLNLRKGFGYPIIRGIGIVLLRSYIEGGDSVEDTVETYANHNGMTASDVRRAVGFARSRLLSV